MKSILLLLTLLFTISSFSQSDKDVVKSIYEKSLDDGKSYAWLDYLSNQIGGRLSGSLNAEKA